ncbi:MAG: HAD hydrolase-like protein [Candidatus Marinimicrobia bacterium]|nr:HAD hydrolase-like protein [Candidatus Neomarinimicrobiota bacterium]
MRLSAVIWDWNGTLLDDVQYAMGCMNRLLQSNRMPVLTRSKYRAVFGFPVEDYYRRVGFDLRSHSFTELSRQFIDHYYSNMNSPGLYRGALKTIRKLKESGITQGILSAMEEGPLHRQLEHNRIREYMDIVQGLDNINARSKVEKGREMLDKLGSQANGVIYIGDTRHDLEVAHELGIPVILLNHGHQQDPSGGDQAVTVLDSFDDLWLELGQRYSANRG